MSVGSEISLGIAGKVILAAIPSIDGGSTFRRKQPERRKSDPNRIAVIVQGQEQPKGRSTTKKIVEYPVLVVLGDKNALTAAGENQWFSDARETLLDLLDRSFVLGMNGPVSFCRVNLEPKFSAVGFEQSNEITAIEFNYTAELDN